MRMHRRAYLHASGIAKLPIGSTWAITNSGDWVVPCKGLYKIILIGGGGGGGGGAGASYSSTTLYGGGGGGAGGTSKLTIPSLSLSRNEVIAVTIGAGGSYGLSGLNASSESDLYADKIKGGNGVDGGPTVFGTYASVDGGKGGKGGWNHASSTQSTAGKGGQGVQEGQTGADGETGDTIAASSSGTTTANGGTGASATPQPVQGYGSGGAGGKGAYAQRISGITFTGTPNSGYAGQKGGVIIELIGY